MVWAHLLGCSDPIVRLYDLRMTPANPSSGRHLASRAPEWGMFAPNGSVPSGAR